MRITKESLKNSVDYLSQRITKETGNKVTYKLVSGDVRLGRVYSIAGENGGTLCSFMSAKELDAYIWGIFKGFSIMSSNK